MISKLVFVIFIRTCTDISFKAAVHHLKFDSFSSLGSNLIKLLKTPYLWAGLIFGLLNVLAWASALKDFDLSYAYPFLSISYITIIISGKILFHEHLDKNKMIGISFISLGAAMLFFG
jgi:multidrug transporter EmrE-like cation transporter